MPTILHIPVHYQPETGIGLPEQRALHAVLLGALHTSSPKLATAVHDSSTKPFTQALLPGQHDAPWVWRITWMDDTLVEPFWQGLADAPPPDLCRRPVQFVMAAARRQVVPYDTLAQTRPALGFQVDFRTPTSFKKRYYHHPLPTPYYCFNSWWGRWQAFAPAALAIDTAVTDRVGAHLVISHFDLHSEVLQDGQRLLLGGVGKITFRLIQTERISARWRQAIAVLAAFAPYCGTGHKTAQGMGVTRVVHLS